MERRDFLTGGAAAIGAAAFLLNKKTGAQTNAKKDDSLKLTPPKTGAIPVAFVISDRFTVIDALGPWEVFQDAATDGNSAAFELYTVAESLEPVAGSAGIKVVPNYTFATAPAPHVVVIGAQAGRSPAMFDWLKKQSETADVIMSVCTGAFILAQSGLIDGKTATTHHDFFDRFEKMYPKIALKKGLRFTEEKKFSSAGGLTSGIDLALRVVERYFGRETALKTAFYMEYQSKSWIV
ncbi:MAG TPA: DJ-1/PfpI family protein [Pyrinomonadaceae bacterium]|jgi:transcriptional regulator GlxA family with amidase domain